MSAPTFEEVDAPNDASSLDAAPTDLPRSEQIKTAECKVCGKELDYGGRGRKPSYCEDHKPRRGGAEGARQAASPVRVNADVNQALATLQAMYDGLGMALMMVSAPAAQQWQLNAATLQEQNRVILTADKNLTASINRTGAKGGKAAFAVAHVVAVAPVVMVVKMDVEQRAAQAQAQRDAAAAEQPTANPEYPGL